MADKTTTTPDSSTKPSVPDHEHAGLKNILKLMEQAMRQDWLYQTCSEGRNSATGLNLGDAAAAAWGEVTIAIEHFRKSDDIRDPSVTETVDILERVTPSDIPTSDDLKKMFQRLRVIADTAPKMKRGLSSLIVDAAATVHVFDVHQDLLRMRSAV